MNPWLGMAILYVVAFAVGMGWVWLCSEPSGGC